MSRNIILLSDGTGFGALSSRQSNVWRLFGALDLGRDQDGNYKQIAFHDDGIGATGFRPIRLISGAFGWGLSRNVRELYTFLCRNYRPGDRIFLFGFSRGAFTVRVLAHFIATCGILDREKVAPGSMRFPMQIDRGLKQGVRQAYKSYRQTYWQRAWMPQKLVASALRSIRNLIPSLRVIAAEEFKQKFSTREDRQHLIEFIGVWDTVDAVGLPVDELSDVLDRFVYPYKFPGHELPSIVARARHALALDEERHSFRPVLWDEPEEESRVKQVWFAGVHTNVGGGYPQDNLAFIALDWMIDEVRLTSEREGLRFIDDELQLIRQRSSSLGKLHDPRSGIRAIFYRYMPRYLDDFHARHVRAVGSGGSHRRSLMLGCPMIHFTVVERIRNTAGYSPIGLPNDFLVVDETGEAISFSESENDRKARVELLDRTRDHVFWRRFIVLYSLPLLIFSVVTMPVFRPPIPGWVPQDGFGGVISQQLAILFDQLAVVIPEFASYWTETLVQSPLFTVDFIGLSAALYFWSFWVEANISELGEGAYWHIKENNPPRWEQRRGYFIAVSRALRTSTTGRRIVWPFTRLIGKVLFALISLYLIFGGSYRLFVHYPVVKEGVCRMAIAEASAVLAATHRAADDSTDPGRMKFGKMFETSDPCFDTGIRLVEGRRYKVTLNGASGWNGFLERSRLVNDPFCLREYGSAFWLDNDRPATFKGLNCILTRYDPTYLGGLPARRHLTLPWFVLVGQIGRDADLPAKIDFEIDQPWKVVGGLVESAERFIPFNRTRFSFQARASGRLYIYVNDAIDSLGLHKICEPGKQDCIACVRDWTCYYKDNRGRALVIYKPFGVREQEEGPLPDLPTITIEELTETGT